MENKQFLKKFKKNKQMENIFPSLKNIKLTAV